MVELIIGVGGTVLSLVTYVLGRRSGKRSELLIRDDLAALPAETASLVTSMLDDVSAPPTPTDPDRGWVMQLPATVGYAPLDRPDENTLLIEFPSGAHSARLLAVEDEPGSTRILGAIGNGVGARFHVRESSDGRAHEVVTLDYVQPLRQDRSLAEMPTQAVYYRLEADGFREVGRGEIYDRVERPWNIPRAVEPFLDPQWVKQQRAL